MLLLLRSGGWRLARDLGPTARSTQETDLPLEPAEGAKLQLDLASGVQAWGRACKSGDLVGPPQEASALGCSSGCL